ncbi:MAG: hypothetical protein JW943_15440 [Deltaproteobacteria bacterium]|nr:hypothetical protein [Deltaproteobacteria bacterium]
MGCSSISVSDEKKTGSPRFLNMLRRGLTHPRLALHLSLVAVIFTLPALWIGFQVDDYGHRMIMLGLGKLHPGPFGFLDVYSVLQGDQQLNDLARDMGILPWWAPSDIRISFLRPLSALLMWMDYKLWPDWPSLMHLHSLIWYGALAAVATALYRRYMGVTVAAGLAALFYAVDHSHALPAAWLANRYALLSTFFGILCLLSYDKWRRDGQKRHGILCPAYLALALLAGEMAAAVGAYLFAYALFLDRQPTAGTTNPLPLSQRLWALWPCAVVFLSWGLAYRYLGYGTHGSGFYIDPLSAPAAFAHALMARAPMLLLELWSHIPLDVLGVLITEREAFFRAVIHILLAAFILIPLIRKDRVARFWLTGMVLSILPVAATYPMSRLLLFIGIGAMGLMAQCVTHLVRNDGVLPASRLWRIPAFIIIIFLVVVRLGLSPPVMLYSTYSMKPFGSPYAAAAGHILDQPEIAKQELIIINSPFEISPLLVWAIGTIEGKALPAAMRVLSSAHTSVEIYRIDENTIRVRIPGGLFHGFCGRLFRSLDEDPMDVQQEFHVTGMTARITAMDKDNGPEEIIYRFSVPLEDKSLKWLQWKDCSYQAFLPPPAGKSVFLPAFNPKDVFRNNCPDKSLVEDFIGKVLIERVLIML